MQSRFLLKKFINLERALMLSRTLLHLYGPFCIYSYGVMIALSCFVGYVCFIRDAKRKALLSLEQLSNVFSLSIIIGIIGGRMLHLIVSYNSIHTWKDLFALQEGGLSIFGTLLALICFLPWYFKRHGLPILPLLDLAALYAPLMQAIARLGCFFAGCCYGKPTSLPWGITYKTSDTLAPLFLQLHPTQLYLASGDVLIFLCLYFILQYRMKKPGQLACIYLALSCINRFLVDFWRGDQDFVSFSMMHIFSLHQWIALSILISSITCLILITRKDRSL